MIDRIMKDIVKKMVSLVDTAAWELKTWSNKKMNPPTKSWKQLNICLVRQIPQVSALIVPIVLAELITRWKYASQHFVTGQITFVI